MNKEYIIRQSDNQYKVYGYTGRVNNRPSYILINTFQSLKLAKESIKSAVGIQQEATADLLKSNPREW